MTEPLELDDIQGNLLRGYRHPDVRYFLLQVGDPTGGRELLDTLLRGTESIPAVQTAADWTVKPPACLNVSITHPGVTQLGVPDAIAATFPAAFVAGSAQRSIESASDPTAPWGVVGIGDIGPSAPDRWSMGGPNNPSVHVVISVFTDESAEPRRDAITSALRAEFEVDGVVEVTLLDGHMFPNGTVHFGFRDGLSQPQIAGRPGDRVADMQPDAPTGDFLLGKDYVNSYRGNYLGDVPSVLGDNGTYMAFRVLEQDCSGFEQFIRRTGERFDMDPELVAAKMIGRWRNGVPVAVSPDDDRVDVPEASLNAFDHAATLDHPTNFDDADGVRCPFGAHMRRMNPRGGPVTGLQHNRRIVRRGVPYGPPFDPANPDDGEERGLLGAFICGDLGSQFEFLYKVWSNMDIAMPTLRGSRDPIIGWQPEVGGRFEVPSGDSRGVLVANDVPRLVTTRGSLYLFVPGIGGLRALAAGQW
jgi:Dyp-type peroxidase family